MTALFIQFQAGDISTAKRKTAGAFLRQAANIVQIFVENFYTRTT